jgi:opacity protein-like surface antigen
MRKFRLALWYPALVISAFICACLMPQPAVAKKNASDYKFQLTPFVGYRFGGTFNDKDTDEEYELNDNPSVGLIINFPSKGNTEWEIYYSEQSTEVKTGDLFQGTALLDMDVQYLQLGGTYLFDRSRKVQPYFVATAGIARMDPSGADTSSDTFFSFAVGGGWKYFPDSRIGIRLDGRFIGTFIDSNSNIFCQSGQGGSCVINTSGSILYQFEMQAGVIFRF